MRRLQGLHETFSGDDAVSRSKAGFYTVPPLPIVLRKIANFATAIAHSSFGFNFAIVSLHFSYVLSDQSDAREKAE